MLPILKTDRLMLRPIVLDDAEAIFEYSRNPNVSRYTLWEPHESIGDTRGFIKDYVFQRYDSGVPEPYGIALKENPAKIIGTVGCFWTSQEAKAMELAYAIAEEYWGNGMVAEAALALMDHCRREYHLNRIQARCKIENISSARVMEKIGMTHEGTLRSLIFHRDRYWDMNYYAKIY